MENRSLGPGMAGRGVCGLAAVWVFWAGSLSPVCREGSHDDDDDGDELFKAWTIPISAVRKMNAAQG